MILLDLGRPAKLGFAIVPASCFATGQVMVKFSFPKHRHGAEEGRGELISAEKVI